MTDPTLEQMLRQHRLLDEEGRLVRWPTKRPHRLLVLSYLRDKFERDRIYAESDVNALLKEWHTFQDWSILRRELIDNHYLSRDAAGREYRVVNRDEDDQGAGNG